MIQKNASKMRDLVGQLQKKTEIALQGGGEKAVARHTSKGKLLVRDRIKLLLDKSTAFLELSGLAASDLYGGSIHSAGIITGIGRIHG